MDNIAIGTAVAVGVGSSVVMALAVSGQRKKAIAAFELLRAKGPMSLDDLAAATNTNVVMKGYLMQALDQLAADGKLEKTPPPNGHPMLRIARDTKYGLPSGVTP